MRTIKSFVLVIFFAGMAAIPALGQSESYQRLATIPDVTSFDWSDSENRMVVLQNAEAICMWDAQTQVCTPIRSYSEIVGEVELSPDGRLLAVGTLDHAIQIINLETQSDIITFEGRQAGEPYYTMAWSHNGEYLAIGANGIIHTFETETWQEEKTFVFPEKALTSDNLPFLDLSWSPNDRYIASEYTETGGVAGVLDIIEVETGIRVYHSYTLSKGAGWIKGRDLFVYFSRSGIRLLDVAAGELVWEKSISHTVHISLSPDGEYLTYAIPGETKVVTLDMDTGVAITDFTMTSRIEFLLWSYDGRYLAVKDSDQQLAIYSSTLPMTTVKGLSWDDANGDGIWQPDELPLSNLALTALDSEENPVATATTDSNGEYHFVVVPGTYTLEINAENYLLSSQNQGTDETLDSDFDPLTHRTMPITIMGKETIDHVNAGLHLPPPSSATPDPCILPNGIITIHGRDSQSSKNRDG